MTRVYALIFGLSAVVAAWADLPAPLEPMNGPHPCAAAKLDAARSAQEAGLTPGAEVVRDGAALNTDVLHYDLDLAVTPVSRFLSGSNLILVRSLVDGLTTFDFNLRSNLTIGEVRVDDVGATWTRLNPDTVRVTLDSPRSVGTEFTLYVAYSGIAESLGSWGSIVFRNRNGAQEVWTLSQPWWAHTWWPVKDDNRDKATGDLRITVPDGMVVASNGLLVDVQVPALGQLKYHWHTDYQTAPYLFSFAATNYHLYETAWTSPDGDVPLEFYLYPESDNSQTYPNLEAVKTMLDIFSDAYGPYPFRAEKYGICEFGYGGGMEHQTMTGQGYFDGSWLSAHELAHSWWGDSITCADWHEIWLNEGLATFSEGLYFEALAGEEWLHLLMSYRRPSSNSDTVYVSDIGNMDRVFSTDTTYNKGAWVFHMLRHIVGDQAFFESLAAYRAAHEGGTVVTADLQAAFEGVLGRDMSWYFTPWVYQVGEPNYFFANQTVVADGRRYVEIYIGQGFFRPLYTMPLDIRLTGSTGFEWHTVWTDDRREYLLIPTALPDVTLVELDPVPWTLHGVSPVTWTSGPPKIVQLSVSPGDGIRVGESTAFEVGFHKDVNVTAADVSLTDGAGNPVAADVTYDNARYVATVQPVGGALAAGHYVLTIADTIVTVADSKRLDGELTKVYWNEAVLPSGNGQEGGSASVPFFVVPNGAGDLDCNGSVDFGDINPFVLLLVQGPAAYHDAYPGCDPLTGDLDGDGQVTFFDINPFVALLLQ